MSSSAARGRARTLLAEAQDKLQRLASLEPFLIDLSLRENPVGSRVGQTLEEKITLLPKLREFGFRNISLGTLDYSAPGDEEVDDDFMKYLRDTQADLRGCYAFTSLGTVNDKGRFIPDPSQVKLRKYGVPNTVHEIYLSPFGMERLYDLETLKRSLPASVQWLLDNVKGEDSGKPRIFINIVDGCDAFAETPDDTLDILELLGSLPIEGVTMEDDRGTYLPFQVGAYVAAAREMLPPPLKILVHIHAGAGFENASVIEALLRGADGVWGGLPKKAAVIGHASLGELLANLTRVGNPSISAAYRLDQLTSLVTGLQVTDDEAPLPDDIPVFGRNAYRLPHSAFRQKGERFMDLPPERIGGRYRYRICPVISDEEPVRGRLAEVMGEKPDTFSDAVIKAMIRQMRLDLRCGWRIDYDEPANLQHLYDRARDRLKRANPTAYRSP